MKKHGCFNRYVLNLVGWLTIGLLAGCGGGSDGGGGTSAPGIVSVSLTDAPACGYEQVNVTVRKVRIHQSDSANDNGPGWSEITLNPPRTINLLNLNDPTQPHLALESLGETTLAAGHYTQLRLVLVDNTGNQADANWIILAGDDPNDPTKRHALETPSAIRSGIKLINQFTVNSGERVDLLLDFDACHSIVHTGSNKYILKPVIKVIPTVLNGIEGYLDASLFTNQPNTNNNVNNVLVTAQVNGQIVRAVVPNTNTATPELFGKFFLARLEPGHYDVVITADGRATKVISGVPVPTGTSITAVSTKSMPAPPLTLESSTTQSVSGTAILSNPADDDGTVTVAAKQSLTDGPTITVKTGVAMVLDAAAPVGDYSYTLTPLPVARPWLGAYSTPLPVSFTEQPADVGGIYTIHGSGRTLAANYNVQTPSPLTVDLNGGSQVNQNFTLTP